jgi:hypothetical protein
MWLHQIIEVVDVGRDFDRDFILRLKLRDEALMPALVSG